MEAAIQILQELLLPPQELESWLQIIQTALMMQSAATPKIQSWLSWFFRGLLLLGMVVIIGRLAELQVIKGAYYRELAEGNRVRRVAIVAPRGKILDKDGVLLVDNEPVKKTVKFDPLEGYTKGLADENTPEEQTIVEWRRKYIYGPDFAHITGYLGEVDAEEVDKVDPECAHKGARQLGSFVGRGGLEQYYNCRLRGIDGEELVEVDTMGNRVRTLGRRAPIPGEDVKTSLNYKLQRKVAETMKGKVGLPAQAGSVIVTDTIGHVFALYSSPAFDPNEDISKFLTDTSLPMFNRVIAGTYHPGSIFKIVTTTAAVEEGKIESEYTYEDKGVISIDEFQYNNWYFTQYGGTEGVINVVRAIARSTDTFFYEVGSLVGAEALSNWAKRFGLSEPTGIDLPGEASGLVPSPEWKKAVKGERWYLGNTYHMAIGQGDLAVTPLANHRLAGFVANGGKLCDLKLVQEPVCRSLNVSSEVLGLIKEGMRGACDAGGTGVPFFDFSPDVGCKTGTAETSVKDETHAWFTVFAPLDNPEYVITVLVEKGGEGSKVAAPIAREIADFIFHP
ncbi:hypothetical protein A2803_00395 [Candidatus Woesebacteria bacterium RIFCSPHIGHO2_01_FULL_44_21]|uniref:Penicillin-binding protein 2 n=1 Tax=Candidatus Woesebacteria bacterium RIFCSPHIGHO2_01_FULL_44_21 TaxID=1802503 RepID=A0A1F7YWF7_9BACT|nr:MAG: hypothetical protein A2803_00395 [Candidatus Woesebacteria bacterium RIFCSPHIGHO2_01_FULL_44_21]OGM68929.1 MAG: hypothetical protein A2897_02090 [Candidatus Woesebacteria bacterium RIFCSPLOWO2_01_FULL_44_24b]